MNREGECGLSLTLPSPNGQVFRRDRPYSPPMGGEETDSLGRLVFLVGVKSHRDGIGTVRGEDCEEGELGAPDFEKGFHRGGRERRRRALVVEHNDLVQRVAVVSMVAVVTEAAN